MLCWNRITGELNATINCEFPEAQFRAIQILNTFVLNCIAPKFLTNPLAGVIKEIQKNLFFCIL